VVELDRQNGRVPTPTEFYKFWIVEERTGKRRLMTYKMARA
jgi:hypothetical protein